MVGCIYLIVILSRPGFKTGINWLLLLWGGSWVATIQQKQVGVIERQDLSLGLGSPDDSSFQPKRFLFSAVSTRLNRLGKTTIRPRHRHRLSEEAITTEALGEVRQEPEIPEVQRKCLARCAEHLSLNCPSW